MGQFAWNTTSGQWHWDAGMYELHGYRDGAAPVSTALILQHKLAEYRERFLSILDIAASGDRRFSNYHAIVDARGRQHTVLVVGESTTSRAGTGRTSRSARGFMVDVTQDEHDSTARAVRRARRSSATVQQSMGLLMGSLALTEDAAFAVISRVSSHHNVKVRDLTQRFMAATSASGADAPRDLSQLLLDQAVALAAERVRRPRDEGGPGAVAERAGL